MSLIAYEKRVLALAGIAQASHLIASAARSGMISQDSLEKSLKSIFVQNPHSFSDIYSGTDDVRLGLSLMSEVLQNFDARAHGEMLKYALAIMQLERGLSQRPDVMMQIGENIIDIGRIHSLSTAESSDDTITSLANLYQSTIGQIQPRLKVTGNKHHLQNIANVQRIRALLLSAVRSAVLWHQVGGRRWQLLLCRSQMKAALHNII